MYVWLASLSGNLFDLDLGVDEKVLRSLLVFLFLVVALRLAGKRELAQLNVLDLVVFLLASNVLQNAMIGDDNSVTGGFIGATTLFVANYAFVRLTFQFPKMRRVLEGKPRVLLEDGKLQTEALMRESIRETELLDAALDKGFDSLDEVGLVVLETNGHLTVLKKGQQAERWKRDEMLG
jgi:uncharacterized membrane protein YcaP (DUF421 family)